MEQELICNNCKHIAHCDHSCLDETCDNCTECACEHCEAEAQRDN